ncbi:hypothetical protein [Sphingomonas paeninsulae]|uniref:hypothetical protein n=1 Tax=Sphingomonas paeninsulae TaxID=2319844 RepID=UPI0013CEB6D3|nr:hypothetical protein [Sphingomonas paeninsulae]
MLTAYAVKLDLCPIQNIENRVCLFVVTIFPYGDLIPIARIQAISSVEAEDLRWRKRRHERIQH